MTFVRWNAHVEEQAAGYRLYVSDDKCTLVRFWANGLTEVAFRASPADRWGPPVEVAEEDVT
jgi:hypothetical protein